MSSPSPQLRLAHAIAACGPNEMLVRFRHYAPGEVVEEPHKPHEAHRFVKLDLDELSLSEVMARCNREFGDPARDIGGPAPATPAKEKR